MFLSFVLITLALAGPAGSPPEVQAVQQAEARFQAGKYAEAVTTLMAAHDRAPQDAAVNYWLARSYYEQKNYDQAIVYAEQAVRLAPNDGDYQRWLGRAYGAKAEESHSFSMARKVKQAFESAVKVAPRNIAAHRDLIEYLVEAPWIVGGDKDRARQEIASVTALDPVEGHLAKATYLNAEKKWKDAEAEYLAAVDQQPSRIDPYMEAAEFFVGRKDADNLDHVLVRSEHLTSRDPRLNYYRAVVLILRRAELPRAEALLRSYIQEAPQRSDYPSHEQALMWLRSTRS